jgi:hypothetical protein
MGAAFQKGDSQILLQRFDLAAESRLGQMQTLGGTANDAVLSDGNERAQLPEFHGVFGAASVPLFAQRMILLAIGIDYTGLTRQFR